ncbi:MAG: hypothetical protein WC604_03720 [Candidatus Gracilibacteria bacterium]
MKKIILFLSLCALVALFSACVIAPKDVKDTAPEAAPDVTVVEEEAEAEEAEEAEEPAEESEEVSESAELAEESVELPEVCLDFPENLTLLNEPFKIVGEYGEGAGRVTLSGTVNSGEEEIWGETVERVYFAIQEPTLEGAGLNFYNYFKGMIDSGNTVNLGSKAEVAIGFALGVIEGGAFSSTAGVSDAARKSIMEALNQGVEISLTLGVPKYEGRGAPANFSFACVIN